MSIRAIARKFHHSRRKVRDAMAAPEPQPYARIKQREAPKLGPFKPVTRDHSARGRGRTNLRGISPVVVGPVPTLQCLPERTYYE